MNYQYWMGTEDSLLALQQIEKEVAELRKAAAANGERSAFMFFDMDDEEDEDTRLGAHLIEAVGDTGVIKVSGSLVNGHQGWHRFLSGRITSYEAIGGALKILAEDESISEILLDINSGGGQVTGLDAMAERVRRADKIKPVRAHTETAAFSAAYWIASSAREVTASRMAEVGSIGTLMVHQSIARMAEKEGIDITVFRAGKFKAAGHPMEELSEEHREYLQQDIETANMFFLEHVSKRRNLMISDKESWAEGKTFFAEKARKAGLVDRITSLDDLLSKSASGAAYQRRSSEMKISKEKLAQIEAGANPGDVLSESELKEYNDTIAAEQSTEGEGEEGQQANGEVAGREAEEEEGAGRDAEDPAEGASGGKAHAELLKDFGRLEARLEAREERISELEGRLTARDETFKSLMAIGVDALQKRQVALGKPATEPTTAESLVNAYNDVSAEMAKRFRVGQQSAAQSTEEEEAPSGVPLALQVRRK